jgi:DNA processing protein
MNCLDESKLQRIGYQLVTSKNQKARLFLKKKKIAFQQLPKLTRNELKICGFNKNEIGEIKNNYIKMAEIEIQNATDNNIGLIFKEDQFYPPLLEQIYDPPDYIYYIGKKSLLKSDKIAVVGSRQGGAYGWSCLNKTIPDLCQAGITIVSGMAYGIDSMAHKITLRENGNTIGVNAGGLLSLYPIGNKGLIDKIVKEGCIISEFSLDTTPKPFYFPIRNRIIAGISKAILVVEAALKSGSLITARLGLEQNRNILAFPGNIDSPISRGTNYLIQQGAKLITSSSDVLEEFGIEKSTEIDEMKLDLSKKERKILELMTDSTPRSIDFFVDRLEYSASETISHLMGLILKNVVREEAGGYKRA